MSKKLQRIITMSLALVLILGLASVYIFRTQLGREDDIEEEGNIVAPLGALIEREEAEVSRITFIGEDSNYTMVPIDCEWMTIRWVLEDNPNFVLNPMQVREKMRFAWQLDRLTIVHENTDVIELSAFGFDPPEFTLAVEYIDGSTKNIYIGTHTVDMRGRFLMVSGDYAMYTITNAFANRLMAGLDSMIDRATPVFDMDVEYMRIAQYGRPDIVIGLTEVTQEMHLMASMAGQPPPMPTLQMAQPLHAHALDYSRLNIFIFDELAAFRIGEVVSINPDSLAPYGLDVPYLELDYVSPHGIVLLEFGDRFFEEIDGREVEFIYVKFANRPHVFTMEFGLAAALFDINIFSFIERFVALINIVDVESLTITGGGRSYHLDVNHIDFETATINPAINGTYVDAANFRILYRLFISIFMEAEIEPFTPTGEPDTVITYNMLDGSTREVRFFAYDSNFYAISLDGADAWTVAHGRDIGAIFTLIDEILG